jgi:hypothetical protein
VNAKKHNHKEVENATKSVGSTSKLVGVMDGSSLAVGPCLYDTKASFSGLWTLAASEEMLRKRDEENTSVYNNQ